MTVYNKSLFYVGVAIGAVGVYLDNTHANMWVLGVVLMLLGTAMILWSIKKPKNHEDTSKD